MLFGPCENKACLRELNITAQYRFHTFLGIVPDLLKFINRYDRTAFTVGKICEYLRQSPLRLILGYVKRQRRIS